MAVWAVAVSRFTEAAVQAMTLHSCLLGTVALLLVGCSDTSTKPTAFQSSSELSSPSALPVSASVPAEQQVYFEDGKISLVEFRDAYSAFAQCASEAGIGDQLREQGRDEITGLITYSTQTLLLPPGQSDGTELNDCFQIHFVYVEMAFQISDPAVLAMDAQSQMAFFNENIRPCLESIDVRVPDDLEFNDENWAQLYQEAQAALQDGRCTSGAGGS